VTPVSQDSAEGEQAHLSGMSKVQRDFINPKMVISETKMVKKYEKVRFLARKMVI